MGGTSVRSRFCRLGPVYFVPGFFVGLTTTRSFRASPARQAESPSSCKLGKHICCIPTFLKLPRSFLRYSIFFSGNTAFLYETTFASIENEVLSDSIAHFSYVHDRIKSRASSVVRPVHLGLFAPGKGASNSGPLVLPPNF